VGILDVFFVMDKDDNDESPELNLRVNDLRNFFISNFSQNLGSLRNSTIKKKCETVSPRSLFEKEKK
tara:strand:+ start:131 stop:331 length:201 start_codon:yes stop_codon:yes gene_type:complete